MNILHVITGLPKAAGTTTFVENVVREQRALGHTVDIVTNANQGEKFHHSSFLTPTSNFDVVHIHGLWSMLLHKAAQYARHRNIPVVWSTHGMTAPWSLHHKWWKKCIPWYLYQKPDLKRAELIHCTTDLEADWNHALGFPSTFIAPLGTNLPENRSRSKVEVDNGEKILLYVGRIYPVKALDNLITAFALAVKEYSRIERGERVDWVLRMVGPDQAGHLQELKNLVHSLCPCDSVLKIEFPGPKFDKELDAEYENCDALALVSHTENFGATVVDAMAHGKPVITSTKTPWKIVADKRCGWWVDNDPETLSRAILQLFNSSTSQLSQMGVNGRALVEQQFTWPAIARNLISQYESVVHHD